MTTFPKDYPRTEIEQVLNYHNGSDTEVDRLILAIYGLIGYQLGKIYPDAQLTSLGHEQFSKLITLQSKEPNFVAAINYLQQDKNLLTDLNNGTLPAWFVPLIFKLAELMLRDVFRQGLFKQ